MVDTEKPLIGVEDMETPFFLKDQAQAAEANAWTIAKSTPRTTVALLGYAWRASRSLTAVIGGLQLTAAVVTALGLLATTNVFAGLLAAGPTPDRVVAALPAIVLVVLALVANGGLEATLGTLRAELGPRIELLVEDELQSGLVEVDLIAFDDPDFAELVQRNAFQTIFSIRSGVDRVGSLISSLAGFVAALVAAGLLNPVLVPLVLLAGIPQAWATVRGAQAQMASIVELNSDNRRRHVTGRLITERESAAEVRAFTARQLLLREHRRIAASLAAAAIRLGRRRNRIATVGQALSAVMTGLAFVVLGLLTYAGWLPLALAGTAVIAMQRATNAVVGSVYSVNSLFETGIHLDLFRTCVDDVRTRCRPPGTASIRQDPVTIELSAVTFRYPGQDRDVLHDINLTLRRGQVIALVGENGSGKTTLAKLITGLYLPASGSVRWDGVDTASVDADQLYERVAVVLQEPLRWPVTAENNIRIGRYGAPDPDGTRFAHATSRSGADAVLADLPGGPETMLSRQFQGGRDLSGGQWQRMSVARGLYRDAPLVVADEPTAAMDARAEHAVFTALRALSTHACAPDGRITILVTHRLANVRHADQIVVLDGGRVSELGTHEELMARGAGYHELFSLQAAAFT